MKIYATYARVSSEDQREKQTIAQQRKILDKFARDNEIVFAARYEDDGESGAKPFDQRPGSRQLLEDARAGKFNVLLICDWDRFTRDLNIGSSILHLLEKELGISVESVTQPVETSPEGKFMRNMQMVFAEYERMKIRMRTMRGTYDAAPEEARYLGGPRPFGYKIEGLKRAAKYVLNNDPIPGVQLSEVEIVQEIYRRAANRESCVRIAGWLETLRVPTVYLSDGRILKATRTETTSPIWRPGRVRNMIVNPMYKGVHVYGQRKANAVASDNYAPVERKVPAVVEPELWERAQSALKANQIFAMRNAKTNYLLRGLMKCADPKCGLTYVGLANRRKSGKFEFYYRCNGKAGARGLYGVEYKRCPSKDINGSRAEDLVWSEVENFLRNPGEVLRQLEEKLSVQANSSQKNASKIAKLEVELKRKDDAKVYLAKQEAERLIDVSTSKTAKELLEDEARSIRFQIEELRNMDAKTEASRAALVTVGSLLGELQKRLDGPLPFEAKRRIVETLVDSVVVETVDYRGKRANRLRVRYKFDPSIVTRKATGSSPQ